MADTGIEGPQACLKGVRHCFGIATVVAGVPLPTIATALGHANLQTTTVYTTVALLEERNFSPGCGSKRRIRPDPASESLRREPVTRMARSLARKLGPSCELHALRES